MQSIFSDNFFFKNHRLFLHDHVTTKRAGNIFFHSSLSFLLPVFISDYSGLQFFRLLDQADEESGTGITCLIASVIIIAIIVWLYSIGSREQRKKAIQNIRQNIPDYIRDRYGSIRLSQVARQWKLAPKWVNPILDEITQTMNGHILDLPNGDRLYEFPDFMRSDTDFAEQLKALNEKKENGFTVKEAAQHLHKDNEQTQIILNQLQAQGILTVIKKRKKVYYSLKDLSVGHLE